ncbi:hypothetical protein [Saccharothrix variisporea]|uniref:Excreted virulence factor EspC (Type VII ESX diderm) n=1 Tax=Saccharothrix variisporea TaxID=543527 RepID=A0A495XI64_9PSEU|nr:hypothetical protein [Saccharothrix variisporea]RKT71288.1 hypothetical protein DFJ66_4571 [Saccharothrix variisporea]
MFTADTGRMRASAKRFRQAGDRVEVASGALAGTEVPGGAFGESGPGPRTAAVLDAAVARRTEGLRRRRHSLADIADRIERDADTYDDTDNANSDDITRAGAQ